MAEHGIQVSVPLIKPIREGVKTQTRRTVKGEIPASALHAEFVPDAFVRRGRDGRVLSTRPGWVWIDIAGRVGEPFRCPYGVRGDRLWVREAWRTVREVDPDPPRDLLDPAIPVEYIADGPGRLHGKFRQGMFMPRWASRLDLEVLDVRVQRLQDISEDDARAEGFARITNCPRCGPSEFDREEGSAVCLGCGWTTREDPIGWFRGVIDGVNGEGTWASNPWVFVIEFRNLEVES